MNKEKLHQKKFYSSPAVDKIIETHADNNGMGYSEALRDIVLKVPTAASRPTTRSIGKPKRASSSPANRSKEER